MSAANPDEPVMVNSEEDAEEAEEARASRYEAFDRFFSALSVDRKVCIVLQHTPDPDAIGSALGLEWLLEAQYGLQCEVYYSGQISHPQNQTEINVLDVRFKHKDDFDPSQYETFVTVDSVPQNTGFDEIEEWHAVFDHHQFDLDLPLTDIRSVGACSSIIWDYIEHFGLDYETERGVLVATALLFGILNDTHNLLTENVSELDIRAHSELIRFRDRKKFDEIVNYPKPPYLFKLRSIAQENMVSEASCLISYLGILSVKRRDALPIIADDYLSMEGTETVVVFAVIDGFVHASVRSRNSSVNVHNFCQKIFGPAYSGGKQGAGGARVPIGLMHSPSDADELKEKISDLLRELITQRILRFVSGA